MPKSRYTQVSLKLLSLLFILCTPRLPLRSGCSHRHQLWAPQTMGRR